MTGKCVGRKPGICSPQGGDNSGKCFVLSGLVRRLVRAFKLNADRKVIAALAFVPPRNAGMPGAHVKRHVLDNFATAPDEQVARHLQPLDFGEIRMRFRVEQAHEQLIDVRPAELPRWQADAMDHDQFRNSLRRSRVAERRRPERHSFEKMVVDAKTHDVSLRDPEQQNQAACEQTRESPHWRRPERYKHMPNKIPDLETLLHELIAAPSVSCVDPALDMSNRRAAECVAGWLEDLAFKVEILEIPGFPGKVNLLATLLPASGNANGGLVLAGHLDTVPALESWRDDPFRLRREGGDYVGLGSADMKGFLAIAARAAANIDPRSLQQPLIILGTADEESSMCGGRALVESGRPQARHAVIGEPTGLRPIRAHKGILFDAIRVHGAAGHSSNPALGHNALEGMHRVMQALMEFRAELQRDWHNPVFDVPNPTMNFGHLHGGDTPNRICADAELHIDLRTVPGMDLPEFRRRLRERAANALAGTAFRVSFESLFEGVGAMETPANAPLVSALESMTGHAAGAVAFSTEGPYLRELDMDVVVWGPGDINQAHQPEERVSMQALATCEQQLVALIEKFCL